jgi:hypothetical protein
MLQAQWFSNPCDPLQRKHLGCMEACTTQLPQLMGSLDVSQNRRHSTQFNGSIDKKNRFLTALT